MVRTSGQPEGRNKKELPERFKNHLEKHTEYEATYMDFCPYCRKLFPAQPGKMSFCPRCKKRFKSELKY